MAFQIKQFRSIAASMINWMRATQNKITDFNVGSVARTLVEATAAELDELYQQYFIGLKEAIPVAVYNSFDFQKLPAVRASGLVRVTITSSEESTLIPAGTVFKTVGGAERTYTSHEDVTIESGDTYADVLVSADVAGVAGNISAGTEFVLEPAIEGMVSATNLAPFTNGSDEESDEARKVRFAAFIRSLNRGTVDALIYGAKTAIRKATNGDVIERVATASVVEPWLDDQTKPLSLVEVYVHNGVGNTSLALVQLTRQILYGYRDPLGNPVPGWKAAGVRVEVYAADEQTVDVVGELTAEPGYDEAQLIADADEVIRGYLLELDIGEPAIRSEIIARVMDIPGVYNIVLEEPEDDIEVDAKTKLMPGTITIT